METMPPLRKTSAHFLQGQPPTPTLPNSPTEAPNQPPHDLALPVQQPLPLPNALLLEPQNEPSDLGLPIQQPNAQQQQHQNNLEQPNAQQQQHQNNLDFPTLVIAFCLTGATEIAAQSLQKHTVHPLYFHSLCLMVVLAFASIFVAKYIAPKQPNAAHVLNNLGVFFGVTAFYFAVTISFPLCLRIISWIIYVISLLAILICNPPRALFSL